MSKSKSMAVGMVAIVLMAVGSIAMAQDFKAVTLGNYDNVTVMEFTGNYDTPELGDPNNAIPRQVIAKEFYKSHRDDYDFLVIFTNFDFQMPLSVIAGKPSTAQGFYQHVKNDIAGIGDEIYDHSSFYGSKGKLQGMIDMGFTAKKVMDALDPNFDETMSVLSHELLHRWSAYVKFRKWDDTVGKDLLGSADAHWSFLLDSKGSLQYGNFWIDNQNGTFTSLPGQKYYSPLDLYLMGLKNPSEVSPMLLIENPEINKEQLPQAGITVAGTPHYVTVNDIIAVEGVRTPNAAFSQKNFKIGCIYLTRPGTFAGRDETYPLRNVLKNWIIWFSSLTKGKAMVKIDTAPDETVPVNPGVTPPPYDPRTAPPSVQDGLAWLLNAQREDGSWQERSETAERETTEAVLTLTQFPEADPSFQSGLAWLSGTSILNTDYLSRKLAVFAKAKEAIGELTGELLSRRNTDGGWGDINDYVSNPIDTAWALQSLAAAGYADPEVIGGAIQYLKNSQNPDGGWGDVRKENFIQSTVNVLYVFIAYQEQYSLAEAIQKGLAWLFGRQNADGGFGNSPSTVYDTALALTLLKHFQVSPETTDKALNFILGIQDANGSWYSSPHQTALAVNALYAWNDAISVDLTVEKEKIVFTPAAVDNPPQKITVQAEVRNLGLLPANQVKVALYDGSLNQADQKGEQIIDLPARTTRVLSFEIEINDAKAHEIFLAADPDNLIKEAREENNAASQTLENLTCMKPDLAVAASDLVFSPENIFSIPQETAVQVKVGNKGRVSAENALIALYDGAISTANKIGEQTVSIPAGASANLSFSFTVPDGKSHLLLIAADADHQLDECIESNNQAAKALSPKTTYDFQALSLSVTPTGVNMAESVTLTSTINNRGTSDAFNLAIRYYIDRQGVPYEIAAAQVDMPAGQSVEQTTTWQADLAGENMTLTVQADPTDLFSELSEENNRAQTVLTVKQFTQANLTINYQDIAISPAPAPEGGEAAISALIRNQGFSEAQNVAVEFYQGSSKADMQLLGTRVIASLAAGQTATLTQTWPQIQARAKRYIMVVIDPQNLVPEISEEDNSAFTTLDILSLPDLAVAANSMAFIPEAPREGEAVTIQITVQNLGDQAAVGAAVVLQENGQAIASGTMTEIAGHSQGAISFSYPTQGKSGGHRIDLNVDPQNLIPEQSKENNNASRSFGVQNADLWLSEPFISPNGDGIKESTQFFFRLKQAQSVQVVVISAKSKIVKTFSGDEFKNTSGNAVTWDGLDDQGRLVMDGQYQFQVRNADGAVLAMLPVIVDTDRSPLTEAIGTPYLFQKNLTCVLPDISWWQWLPDESGIVFSIQYANANTPGYSEGIYRISADGEEIQRLVPAEWCQENGTSYSYFFGEVAVSADGNKIAFGLNRYNKETQQYERSDVWIMDRYGENRTLLLSSELSDGYGWFFYNLYWSPDNRFLAYYASNNSTGDYKIGIYDLSDDEYTETPSQEGYAEAIKWAPDSTKVCYASLSTKLVALDIQGAMREIFAGDNNAYLSDFEWLNQDRLLARYRKKLWLLDATENGNHKLLYEQQQNGYGIRSVAVNPKDQTIAFITGDYTDIAGTLKCRWQLNFGDLQGSYREVYASSGECANCEGAMSNLWGMAWSPDGQKIAFYDQEYEKTDAGQYHAYAVMLDKETLAIKAVRILDNIDLHDCWELNGDALQWFQDNESLLAEDKNGIYGLLVEDGGRKAYFPVQKINEWDRLAPSLSPRSRYVTYTQEVSSDSICYQKGWSDLWNMGSLLNLTADLKVIKNKNSITLKGTAADLHFQNYVLEYADSGDPLNWKPIVTPADEMIVDTEFLDWVPPDEGIFLVRLVVQDKAGNTAWDRKRVSWGQSIFLNDLKQSDKIFSPNNDGVNDTLEISYQVTAPAHLQFFIYDDNGRLIRTIQKNHEEPGRDRMVWDGQDEQGATAPDGHYRIRILDYEFAVEVDTIAPALALQLEEETILAGGSETGPVDMRFRLEGLAADKNLKEWSVEYGEGENPSEWYLMQNGTEPFMKQNAEGEPVPDEMAIFGDELFDFPTDKRFRITAADSAGNRVAISNDLIEWKEEIFITRWDSLGIDYEISGQTIIPAEGLDLSGSMKPGVHTIRGIENIRQPLQELDLQYYRDEAWENAAITVGDDSGHVAVVWDNSATPVSELEGIEMVRLRVVDLQGNEYFSPALLINPFRFYLSGEFRCRKLKLKGEIELIEDLKRLQIQLQSPDDPLYKAWTDFYYKDIEQGATIPSGEFTIPGMPDLQPALQYSFRMIGTGKSGKAYQSEEISSGSLKPAACFSLKVEYPEAECNGLSGKAKLSAKVEPGSKPVAVKKISFYLLEEETWKLLGQGWGLNLNTAGWPEKAYAVKAVLDYEEYDGDSKSMTAVQNEVLANVYVNRVMPISEILFPQDGIRVCPKRNVQEALTWYTVSVEGAADDDQGEVQYALYYGIGENPAVWKPARTCRPVLEDGAWRLEYKVIEGQKLQGETDPWDVSDLIGKENLRLKLKTIDRTGNVNCRVVSAKIQTQPGLKVTSAPAVFSPNQDGLLDETSASITLNQDGQVSLQIFKIGDPQPVKTFFISEFKTAGTYSLAWDGADDNGQRVADGEYQIKANLPNGCDESVIEAFATIEVDTTPPLIEIAHPKPETKPGLMIEVKGTVDDPHFKLYQLTVPEINTLIGSGDKPQINTILGRWNRYGLNGRYTLKLAAEDTLGNKSEKTAEVQLDAVADFIKKLEAAPYLFSPNDDGKLEKTIIRYDLSNAVPEGYFITITVLKNQAPIRTYAPVEPLFSGTYEWEWDGKDNEGRKAVDGEYAIVLTASHVLDQSVSQKEEVTVEVDTIPPAMTLSQPAEGSFVKEDFIAFEGSITDENLVNYDLVLTAANQAWPVESGKENRINYLFGNLAAPADGPCLLTAKAQDLAQLSTERLIAFHLDRTPPKVALKAPLEGEWFGKGKESISIKGSIEENNLKQWTVSYGRGENPQQWTDLLSSDSLPTVEELYPWQVGTQSGIADGSYTIRLYVKDKAGWETEARVKVMVDNTPPLAVITLPPENGYITKALDIQGTAFDENLAEYTLEISAGDCGQADKWTLLKKETKSVQNGTLALFNALPPDGRYCLRLKAVDRVGYESESKIHITVDTTPPLPPALSGKVREKGNAWLNWTANAEPDLDGYNLYRDNQKINASLIKETQYADLNLKEGIYHYMVKAVDQAGCESNPSNQVGLKIDLTPPAVRILSPANGAKVNDIVAITGTAYSEEDFKEYRLYAGQGLEPAAWSLLLRSPVPVPYGRLADWDTIALSEDSYAIRLEAEDLSGNTNTHRVAVQIDNAPPAPPVLTKAEQQEPLIPNVELLWEASPDADVIGYLVYRNHELANVSGSVIGDLKPYLVNGTSYTDKNLPDGAFTYSVMAMDEAGNISEQSNVLEAVIDTHAPRVMIAIPADNSRFETTLLVKSETQDLDIAQVQFQYQKPAETAWNDLNGPVNRLPYTTYLDPQALNFVYGSYKLRAKGIDLGGRTDDNPAQITVNYTDTTAPAGPLAVKARADEGRSILTWQANADPDLKGYNVYLVQNEQKTKLNTEIVSGTTTYLHGGQGQDALADGEYVYELTALDTYGNESRPSSQVKALIYTPLLEQPYTPSGVSPLQVQGDHAGPNDTVEIYASADEEPGSLAGKVLADDKGEFAFSAPMPFNPVLIRVQAGDGAGNRSKKSEPVFILYNEAPATPTGLQGAAQDYTVQLTWDANNEADLAGYFLYRDGKKINPPLDVDQGTASASVNGGMAGRAFDQRNNTNWYCYVEENAPQWWQLDLPAPEPIQQMELDFYDSGYAPRDYDIQAWTGYSWLTLLQIKENNQAYVVHEFQKAYRTQRLRILLKRAAEGNTYVPLYEVYLLKANPVAVAPQPSYIDHELEDGEYEYQVSAVDIYGLESSLSAAVNVPVGDVTAPAAPIDLTAAADQANIILTWSANGEPDLAGYQVYRNSAQGWSRINSTLVTAATYIDANLANGAYTYRVTAIDQTGNESDPSEEASASIAVTVPQEPINLQITVIPEGRALKICWEYQGGPVAGFNLYRALAPGGPYVRVNAELIKETCHLDESLTDGVKYYYYVAAVDAFGNEGENSLEGYAVPQDTVAPDAPVIFFPTSSSAPLEVDRADQTLIGFAEAESLVELFKAGDSLGKVFALKSAVEENYALSSNTQSAKPSPDGRKVALIENNRLSIRDFETNQTVTLSDSHTIEAHWLPDKKRLSFTAEDENWKNRIFIYDLGTGQKTKLTDDAEVDEYYSSWSRDGKWAAFISSRDNESKVWTRDLVSGEMKNIPDSNGALYPEISANGSKVVYFKNNTLYLADVLTGESQAIDSAAIWPNGYGTYAWSPEGKRLGYISKQSNASELYLRDLQSGEVEQVTHFQGTGLSLRGFTWAPDGKSLLCLTENEGAYALWTMTAAASQSPKVLKQWTTGYIQSMDWISTGEAVYHYYADGGANELGLIQPPGLFTFGVILDPGSNDFTATARDAAGNRSQPSETVTLILPEQLLPDLEIKSDTIFVYPAAPLAGDQVRIYAVVENKSPAEARDFFTNIYLQNADGEVVLLKSEFMARLEGQAGVAIPITLEASACQGSNTVMVMADAEDRVYELSEKNNYAQRDFFVASQEGIAMTTGLDAQEYQAQSALSIRIAVNNSGTARDLDLAVQIEDENGTAVHVFEPRTLNLAYGAVQAIDLNWNTGLTYAGHYRVHAALKEEGTVVLENTVSFEIVPEIVLTAELSTDKLHYAALEDVLLNVLLVNQGRNFDIPHLDVKISVLREADVVFRKAFGLDNLPAGASVNLSAVWNSALWAAGDYTARAEFLLAGEVIASSDADFIIDGEIELSGSLQAVPLTVYFNQPVRADFTISNKGNTSINEAAVRVLILDPDTQTILASQEQTVTMDQDGNGSGQCTFGTVGLGLKTYKMILQILPQASTLATAGFSIKDGTAPVVSVLAPQNQSNQYQAFDLLVQVADDVSGVERVEYRFDQESSWHLLVPVDPAASRYGTRRTPVEADEGPHTVHFRALDRNGNVSEPVSISIQIVPKVELSLNLNAEQYNMHEDVGINAHLTNTAWAKNVTLQVSVKDQNGNLLHHFDALHALLAVDEAKDFDFTWNTGSNPAGSYKVAAVLTKAGSLLSEKERAFVIADTTPPGVTILSPPDNSTQGGSFDLTVTAVDDASGVDHAEYQIDSQAWQPLPLVDAGLNKYSMTWTPVSADNGPHTIAFRAADKAGNTSQPVSVSITIDLETPFEKLTGTLQAAPNPVQLGQEESFQYSVRNETYQALQNLVIKILVIDPDDQETKLSLSETIHLAENSTHTGTLKGSTAGLALRLYGVVFKVEMSGQEPRKLAESAFEVIASQALEAGKSLADETRLLVWVNDNCPASCRPQAHGHGMQGQSDFHAETNCQAGMAQGDSLNESMQNQEKLHCDPYPCKECLGLNLLKTILDQVAEEYKIVFTPCAFAEELRNPFYTDILILGGHHSLPDHLAAELREKVHSGTGVISSQWLRHGCPAAYDEVFGVTDKGRLPWDNPLLETGPSPITEPGTFETTGKAFHIQPDQDTLTAGWIKTDTQGKSWDGEQVPNCPNPSGPYAAIVLHDYSQGRAVYYGFDLGRSLGEASREWIRNLLKNSLDYVHRNLDAQDFAAGQLVPIHLEVKNLGSGVTVRVNESFPGELELYDPVAKQWIDESPWIFDTPLGEGEEKSIRFYYLAPDKAGTYETRTDIGVVKNGELISIAQLALAFTVAKDLDAALEEAIHALKALALPPHDQAKINKALGLLAKIKAKTIRTSRDPDHIIQDLIKAVDYLRGVKSMDMSAYRLALDRIIRTHESMYYLFVPPGEYLSGTLEATPNPARSGQEVHFRVAVFNDGKEAFRDLKLKVIISDSITQKAVQVIEQPLVLEGNTRREIDLKILLKNFKPRNYQAVLKAYSGLLLHSKVLAEMNLKVVAP